jgi:UDP-glucose 4-epimerase|tara:strand:- start:1049 stop:1909 length:861 start_codon:yes stop_codon:yes gene_type:complete
LRVLLTGGTGFVGKNLISYLTSKQISVDNLSREILKNDKKLDNFLNNKQSDLNQNFDVLIHLAAELDSSSKQLVPVNVSLTKKLLDLCVKNKIKRFIFTSTHVVYGKTNYLPIDEEHPKLPKTNYGESKLLAEKICKSYSKDFDLQITLLRISSVFGFGQNEKYIIPRMFKDALSKKITLHKYSNGYQLMDLIHVDDVSKAIFKACKAKKFGIYNLASGIGTTPFNLAKIISKFVDGCEIFIENKKGETNHFLYDVSKIEKEINFTAKSKPNFKILKPWFDKINLN